MNQIWLRKTKVRDSMGEAGWTRARRVRRAERSRRTRMVRG
jgi:hypothetical protein